VWPAPDVAFARADVRSAARADLRFPRIDVRP